MPTPPSGPCPKQHTTKADGRWIRGDDEAPGLVVCGNGAQQVKMQCNHCGHRSSPLPYKLVRTWRIRRKDIAWTKQNDPNEYLPCVREGCDVTPTELHHFAPRNTFGGEADLWPVAPLCRTHHIEWHQRMDGYRWQRPGIEAAA